MTTADRGPNGGLPLDGPGGAVPPIEDWSPGTRRAPELMVEYARLRDACPVAFSAEFGGFWTLSRYADIRAAATNTKVFRNGRPFLMDMSGDRFIPESLNPPEHTAYRRLLNPHFTPHRMAALEPAVTTLVRQHLEPMVNRGSGEFVSEVAYPLPTRVLCAFLNLPDELWPDLKAMTRERTVLSTDPDKAGPTVAWFYAEIDKLIEARQRAPLDPDNDLVTGLLVATVEGRSLRHDEIAEICYQVIIAGADTTSATLGSAAYLLASHPEQQARLRSDPGLIPAAVEEMLRLEPALHYMGRTIAGGITLHGRELPDGATVALNFASANRDPTRFRDPDSFDAGRQPNPHLTFGHGIHKCVGAPVARLELTVVLRELAAMTKEITFAGEPQRGSVVPAAFRAVPLRFIPS